MKNNSLKQITLSLVVISILTACGGDSSKSTTNINSPTPTPTSVTPTSTESIAPKKPIVSNVPKSTVEDKITIELIGEVDATVWVNDEEVATIDSDGKVEITLDTSGKEGSKTFSIVLKNAKGGVSEPLVILIEKKDLPTVSPNNTTPTSTPPVVTPKKGVLIDSVIAGVRYQCGSKTGKTDENGTFECSVFPAIFTVANGKIEIGRINSISSDSKVFIQDLVGVARDNFTDTKVFKIAKLLQSLDDDGDYDTAIKIDDSGVALVNPKNIDDLNITEVESILRDNGLTVVSDEQVISHLIENASPEVNRTIAKDKYDVFLDKKSLTFAESLEPTETLVLPSVGAKGSQYSYNFTDEENALLLNRPSFSDKNKTIVIRATISKGTVSDTKNFTLILIHQPIADLEAVTLAKTDLTIDAVLSAVDSNLTLKTVGLHGTTVSWSSSSLNIRANTGEVTRPSYTNGNVNVTLIATITKGNESVTKEFIVTVLKLPITDAESVANVKRGLDLGDTSALTSNLTLPTEIDGVTITWSSSGDAISNTGVINPSDYTGNDKTATLIATLTKGNASDTKEFTIVVPKLAITDAQKVAVDKVGIDIGLFGDALLEITNNITLPTTGTTYLSTITWDSNNTSVLSNTGEVTRPSYTMGDKFVTITGTIVNGSATDTIEMILGIKHLDMTGTEMIADAYSRLDFNDIKGTNTAMNNIVANLSLPSNLIVDNGSNVLIKWESTPSTLIESDGTIHAPSFTDGNTTAVLKATIGVPSSTNPSEFDGAFATVSKEFNLVLVASDMTDAKAVALDTESLNLGDTSRIYEDMTLPITGINGTTITYHSDNTSFLSNTGVVTEPVYTVGNQVVTLTATITKGEVSLTKVFSVTILALPMNDVEAVALSKRDLNVPPSFGAISNNVTFPYDTHDNGVGLYWETNNTNVLSNTGIVTRPSYSKGDTEVLLTVTFIRNYDVGAIDTKSFTVIVKALPMSNSEAVELAKADLTLGDTSNVTTNVVLPTVGLHGTKIQWSSDNTYIFSDEGIVHRPEDNDFTVHLTATISKEGGASKIKSFEIIVKKKEQDECDSVSRFLGYCGN